MRKKKQATAGCGACQIHLWLITRFILDLIYFYRRKSFRNDKCLTVEQPLPHKQPGRMQQLLQLEHAPT